MDKSWFTQSGMGRDGTTFHLFENETKKRFLLILRILVFVLTSAFVVACQVQPGPIIPPASPSPTHTATLTPSSQAGATSQPEEEQVISTPTLAPTATPGPLDWVVEDIVRNTGIDDLNFFGINGENLINLLISVVIVCLGGLAGVLVVNAALWLARRTPSQLDNRLLQAIEKQLKLLIPLFFLQFATARLAFLSPAKKQWLDLIYFTLFVIVIGNILWNLIDLVMDTSIQRASSPRDRGLLVTFTPLLRRTFQVIILLVGLVIILQNYGVNLSALLAILGLGGLAVSLAAKETLEDMISGFLILIDRPYQMGDRIKIDTMDVWGDVERIGARTTRIRTLDNRLIIIPNSVISKSQVDNYSYPDPSYQIGLALGIGYGSNIDHVIETIKAAVGSIRGLPENPPPVVVLDGFGESAMNFRVLYWLKSYQDIFLKTEVNKAIYQALVEENIELPFTTYDINLAYQEPAQTAGLDE